MELNSTHNLLLLHTYNETSEAQKEFLSGCMAEDPAIHEDMMEMIRAKRMLSSKMKSPSNSSVRIIMEHSYKTEHLQEI